MSTSETVAFNGLFPRFCLWQSYFAEAPEMTGHLPLLNTEAIGVCVHRVKEEEIH